MNTMSAFVNDQAPVELTVRFYNLYRPDSVLIRGQVKSTEITKGAASDLEAERLLLRAGDEVYRIRRIRHRKGRNFLVEDAMLPAELVPGLADATTIADDVSLLADNTVFCSVKPRNASPWRQHRQPSRTFSQLHRARRCYCWIALCTCLTNLARLNGASPLPPSRQGRL